MPLSIDLLRVLVCCLALQKLFIEAVQNGTMEGFYKLISHFQTQSEPAYCGLASLSMVLNALAIDPGRTWKGANLLVAYSLKLICIANHSRINLLI